MSAKLSAAGALAAAALAGPATAQSATPSGPPPSWDSLIPCAQKADPVEGFRCYQAAVRAAGYAPNPEIAAAERRRTFGLTLPFVGHKAAANPEGHAAKTSPGSPAASAAAPPAPQEDTDRVTVVLDQVALIPPLNRLLLITKEGAVWQQTDSETVAPAPKPGQTMTVVHGSISGFFCQFDKRTKVRCTRTH